jgi:hypothetical protein
MLNPESKNPMTNPTPDVPIPEPAKPRDTSVDTLLRIASAARLIRSADGCLRARVKVGDRQEVYALRSAPFRDWLTKAFFAECQKPPSQYAIRRVISVLEAQARFDDSLPSVFVRVAADRRTDDTEYYVDLGDRSGQAVYICAEGWCVVDKAPVDFWRPEGLLPLPVPQRGGSLDLLRKYVNLNDRDWRLFVVWLTAAYRPVGPYPILVLHGEQGSAKSTHTKIARLLIDPQVCPFLAEPRSTRDLMVTALNGWLLAFDNLSTIPTWLSDALCMLGFGGGYAGRTNYTDDERKVVFAVRPVILNGIHEFLKRGDAIDRAIILLLDPIRPVDRRSEDEFWKAFRADYPLILGALFDAIVGGLRELPSIRPAELPRMADFARWGEAVGRALGWDPGEFLSAYRVNRWHATAPVVEDSLVATTMLEFADSVETPWIGNAEMLLHSCTLIVRDKELQAAHLDPLAGARRQRIARTPGWPGDTRQFCRELRRILPQLRVHGVSVSVDRGPKGQLIILDRSPLGGTNEPDSPESKASA